ncbi:hypothetical protein HAX54_023605, partial [Datura stramonium]|nr:hypothetical protein [Datura stramonium]
VAWIVDKVEKSRGRGFFPVPADRRSTPVKYRCSSGAANDKDLVNPGLGFTRRLADKTSQYAWVESIIAE